MHRREPGRDASRDGGAVRGMVLVAATYFYFLLFAQFGFLRLLQTRLAGAGEVRGAMAAMGLAGLAASLLAAVLLGRWTPRRLVRAGFAGCAAAALAAPAAASPVALGIVAAAIGASVGLLTVALACGLRGWMPERRFALYLGVATGAAYLACNLPPLFEARPAVQAWAVAAGCLLGWWTAGGTATRERSPEHRGRRGDRLRFAAVLLSFLALVWIDSAAFAVIQDSARLQAMTWGGPGQKLILGGLHLLAAVAAGWLLDRGRLRELLLATLGLFAIAFATLTRSEALGAAGGPLYVIGISFYSVALIAYAARRAGDRSGRWRVAWLYGVAGWLGSALGVGMAQELHALPMPLLAAAVVPIAGSWLLARPALAGALAGGYGRAAIVAGAGIALAFAVDDGWGPAAAPATAAPANGPAPAVAAEATRIARGRRVYLGEGCINCHSSFVRCGTEDETLWGPCGAPSEASSPPLIGNRRQGPDLLNAGNRRSAEWHRAHLKDPRTVSPASRMPSYAHLFEQGSRGEDLVAYLASRGAESRVDRFYATQSFPVPDPRGRGSAARGAALFVRHCAVCHGHGGRGDGPLSRTLTRPARDLTEGSYRLVPFGPGLGTRGEGLARVIRFGVPGTSMPGHEYFSDREIADLVAYVRGLARVASATSGAAP